MVAALIVVILLTLSAVFYRSVRTQSKDGPPEGD